MTPPVLEFFATFSVQVDAHLEIGTTLEGHRRIVPITGGTVRGPRISGKILPGGADFQVAQAPDLVLLEANYAVELDDGDRIYVTNRGIRSGLPSDMTAVAEAQPVDPRRLYFRCTPRLHATSSARAWLDRSVFVATGERHPDHVELNVFRLI